jgi:Uma2 family endonuclease
MVEVTIASKTLDLPYTVRVYDVTEAMFDELVDEDTKAELIDGVMLVHSPASIHHDDVAGFLRALMRGYADERGAGLVLGPDALIHLASCRKFGPDIFFVRRDRVPTPLPKELEGAPDLVVEVLSPSNWRDDLYVKRALYRDAGVGEIWFVDPETHRIVIDRKREGGYLEDSVTDGRVSSTVLEGFWIDGPWLWAEPLPKFLSCLRAILAA